MAGTGWVGLGWAGRYLTGSPLQLLRALARLRDDRQVRVLLFRSGVKGVFCAGGCPPFPHPGAQRGSPQPAGVGVGTLSHL